MADLKQYWWLAALTVCGLYLWRRKRLGLYGLSDYTCNDCLPSTLDLRFRTRGREFDDGYNCRRCRTVTGPNRSL